MTDTRMVRLEQIAAGKRTSAAQEWITQQYTRVIQRGFYNPPAIMVRQIGDATGGDVYEPTDAIEAGLAEAFRRAKWKHQVQVEVING